MLDLSKIAGGNITTTGRVDIKLIGNITGKTFNVNAPNADVIDQTTGGTINVIDAANSSYYYQGSSRINFNDNNGRFVNLKSTPADLFVAPGVTVTLGGKIGTVIAGENVQLKVEETATVKEVRGDETVVISGPGAGKVEGVIATVSNQTDLKEALKNASITKIALGKELKVTAPIIIDRAVTIEGNNIVLDKGFEIKTGEVTIQNLTIKGQGYTDNASADVAIYVSDTSGKLVTFKNLNINYAPSNGTMFVGGITAVPGSNIQLQSSTIAVEDAAVGADADGSASIYTYGKISVTGLVSNSPAGVVIDHANPGLVGEIKGNKFNGTWVGVSLFNSASQEGKTREETKAYVIVNNEFNEGLGDWKVSARDN